MSLRDGNEELSGVTSLAGGRLHTCAVISAGKVFCWGANQYGALGDGTILRRLNPVRVEGLSDATVVAAGGDHTCALDSQGKVYCWGSNAFGQLGTGDNIDRATPVQVEGLFGVTALTVGRNHSCVIVAGGEMRCWGWNAMGQLGDGNCGNGTPNDTTHSTVPVAVLGLSGVTAIAAADAFHTCARVANGSMYCWGWNQHGQLGKENTTRFIKTPQLVEGLSAVTAIAVGGPSTCAVVAGGEVRCWGWNTFGQLGNGERGTGSLTDTTHSATPQKVSGLSGVTAISEASGTGQFCVITANRKLLCWGHNGMGQLGDGTNAYQTTPVAIALSNARVVTGGGDHTCAIIAGGRVRCWGFNQFGQVGEGSTTNRTTPVAVSFGSTARSLDPVTVPGVFHAEAIAAGGDHTCALIAGGRVQCWGSDELGQLGDGNTLRESAPVGVKGLSGVVDLAAGWGHTCAVVSSGAVLCWGSNAVGQLGDGTFINRSTPVAIDGIVGATAVAAGRHHTCAVVSGGAVRCWGHNFVSGPLGVDPWGSNGGPVVIPTPVAVMDLIGAIAVSVRGGHTCVTVSGAEMRCWGLGVNGELANRLGSAKPLPVLEASGLNLSGVTAMATGGNHSCAVLGNGETRCWGWNDFGQLGDGTTTSRYRPVVVNGLSAASAIVAGSDHSCALAFDGVVSCWGWNDQGQLGDRTTISRSQPVAVRGLHEVRAIAAGWRHTCAIVSNGTVQCWGRNDHGQLGKPARR